VATYECHHPAVIAVHDPVKGTRAPECLWERREATSAAHPCGRSAALWESKQAPTPKGIDTPPVSEADLDLSPKETDWMHEAMKRD